MSHILLISLFIVVILFITYYLFKHKNKSIIPNAKAKHLIVISIDALRSQDLDYLSTLPNFQNILKSASYAEKVRSIYPSLTYPCHTTMISGNYPIKHGIVNNIKFDIGNPKPDWFWYSKDVKCNTLYKEAKKHNLKVGSVFWPVMANAHIDYNLAEIWPHRENQTQTSISLSTGTKPFILNVFLRYRKLLNGIKQPNLDNFACKSASYMIRKKKPNLALFHLIDVDDARHKHGKNSKEAFDALERQDKRINEIIQASKDAGTYYDTAFIILGDHSFIDIDYKIFINSYFKQNGLIKTDEKGNIIDWDVYGLTSDGSCQIKLKDTNNAELKDSVYELLIALKNQDNSGIERIYCKEDIVNMGVSTEYDFMLEAKKGYCFKLDWNCNEIIKKLDHASGEYKGTHGFHPDKPEYETLFIAFGKGINSNVVIPSINLVDIAPTMANILGLELKNVDGEILHEFIR